MASELANRGPSPTPDPSPPGNVALFTSLVTDLTVLVRQELRLLRTEFSEKATQATRSVSLLVTGGFVAYVGVIILVLAASFGLAQLLPLWLAALLIGLLVLISGILVLQSGRHQLQRLSLFPEKTVTALCTDTAPLSRHGVAAAQEASSAKIVNPEERSMWQVLKETIKEWSTDQASQLAAALAYYTAVSIAPLLVLVVVLVGFFLGKQAAQSQLIAQLRSAVGPQGAQFLQTVLENAAQPTLASLAGLLSLLTLLWGSTSVFSQLQSSLNAIWNVTPKPGRSWWTVLKERFLSFSLVIGIAFLLLISLVLSAVLTGLSTAAHDWLPGADWLWEVINFVISFLVITGLFAAIYKVLPDAEIRWRDVWPGAAVTALLFTIGKFLLGLYLAHAGSAYGAVGSLAVFLLWVYYAAQILFLGAEFTQVYARHYGAGIQPAADAVRVEKPPTRPK